MGRSNFLTAYDVLLAYEENARRDKAQTELRKAIFGFNPAKRWTGAQKKRAKTAAV